jgi:hypothetical protein
VEIPLRHGDELGERPVMVGGCRARCDSGSA